MDLVIDAKQAFEKSMKDGGINLFLGAGFSVLAKNKDNENLFVGNELKDSLINHFGLEKYKDKDLAFICSKLKRTKNGELFSFLKDKLSVKDYDSRYKNIFSHKIRNIVTLNIDDLLEVLFTRDLKDQSLIDTVIYGVTEHESTMLFKIHGSVTYSADSDYYFTSDEIISYNLDNPARFQVLSMKIASYPTLFWGINIDNMIVRNFINSTRKMKNIQPRGKWILLLPDSKFDEYAEELREDGYNIIRGTTEQMLDYLSNIRKVAVIYIKNKHTVVSNPFNKYLISTIKKSNNPVRPISNFYEGGDAIWSDIFNKKIEKLSYFYTIMNDIENGHSRHISGIPGSGKTTLLMQIAANLQTQKEIYYFEYLQKNVAEQFSTFISEKPCYVFLDNLSDNLEAMVILIKKENIIFVTAERDHKYETLQQRISFSKDQTIDISDIKDSDIQRICNSMSKKGHTFITEKSSLFEIVYNIHSNKKLNSKITEMTNDLKNQNHELYELFILLTYMRWTNVFASIETLLAYFLDSDYQSIYHNISVLRSAIHETEMNNYDLFSLRSRVFAEASLSSLPREDIANVITKFLERVPPSFINRYDIFRIKAYDADITYLAFKDDLESGKYFYELLISRDDRAFNKQQYALYLQRNHQNNEAWKYIDEAYNQCNGRNYTIVNSHAMILFENNIDKTEDRLGTVETTLSKTFEVLENCIDRDDRKPFHVLTYAKHSVKYYNRYHNEKAKQFLLTSRKYLQLLKGTYIPHKAIYELRDVEKEINSILKITPQGHCGRRLRPQKG